MNSPSQQAVFENHGEPPAPTHQFPLRPAPAGNWGGRQQPAGETKEAPVASTIVVWPRFNIGADGRAYA
jgi:hypothetical protein